MEKPQKLALGRSLRFGGAVRPPGSKSIANRVLPIAALAQGTTRLENLPDGDDVTLMRRALADLEIFDAGIDGSAVRASASNPSTDFQAGGSATYEGRHAFHAPNGEVSLFLGNSGTATRILTALLAAGEGIFHIDGVPRMRQRPIGDLVDALRPLAGNMHITYDVKKGFPPLTIRTERGLAGGKTKIRGNLSSQFVTGLLMAMPLCRGRVEVEIEGDLVSAPYVDLTLQVMRDFGAVVERDGHRRFWMEKPVGYTSPGRYSVEPDASSASYFLAGAAIANGSVEVQGIRDDSPQGESGFAGVLEKMGADVQIHADSLAVSGSKGLRGLDVDMDLMSDTGMTLAIVALFAEGKTTIRNVGNWRLKETDRLKAMAAELRKLGATVEEGPDWISIAPPQKLIPNVEIDTYDDHRMAMCFSLVSLGPKGVPVVIRDPGCVSKTYPGYFEEFRRMTEA